MNIMFDQLRIDDLDGGEHFVASDSNAELGRPQSSALSDVVRRAYPSSLKTFGTTTPPGASDEDK